MIYAISDIHGYPIKKIKALFESVGFSQDDFCFCLGDVIDRGSDGVEILRWMMKQPNMKLILGNHEAMLLSCDFLFKPITNETVADIDGVKMRMYMNWAYNGCEPTVDGFKGLNKTERAEILAYLRAAPSYDGISVGNKDYILTHSGFANFSPSKHISDYRPHDLMWNRPEITDRYFDDMTVIFGHTPTAYYGEQFKGKVLFTDTWIDIDCGAAGGLPPALLRLDDMQVFYAESI